MKRREFITLLGGAAVWPLAARGQQLERIRRIGILMGFAQSDPNAQHLVAAFRSALATLGQIEGKDVRVELRWAAGDTDRMRTFARELVELQPDVIVAQTTPVLRAVAIRNTHNSNRVHGCIGSDRHGPRREASRPSN